MFTVSCYAFHPFVLQFVRIWRYTQVVSEVLTCILSMVCCQCMNMMLLSNRSSNESQFSVQRFKDDFVNHTNFGMVKEEGESPRTQYTVVDVHPEAKIPSKAQTRCGEGWQFGKSDQELQDKMEFPVEWFLFINPRHKNEIGYKNIYVQQEIFRQRRRFGPITWEITYLEYIQPEKVSLSHLQTCTSNEHLQKTLWIKFQIN